MNVGDFIITLEVTIDQANEMVNMCNNPLRVPTVTWAKYIDLIQQQAQPQIAKMEASMAVVKKSQEERKDE
jgi:hypothetical protein